MAPKVRLRTLSEFWVDWLEAERYQRVDSIDSQIEEDRRSRVRDDIAARIKRACCHLGEEEFLSLVDEMTERQLNGERRVLRDFLPE